jgi:hypothetical protein
MKLHEILGISLLPVDPLASEEEFGTMESSFFDKKQLKKRQKR